MPTTTPPLSLVPAPEPGKHDGYTTEPTRVRLWADRNGDGVVIEWGIDGADDDGNYTEGCWTYDTRDEALAAIPEFIAAATFDGVSWHWRARRPALVA